MKIHADTYLKTRASHAVAPAQAADSRNNNPIFIRKSRRNLNSIDLGSGKKKGLALQKEENPEFLQS